MVHPHATGPAAETVAKHQEPQDLVFWAAWFCPFVHRTWIALEERGIPYKYHEVNPYDKEKHFLEINPKGLVPAIEYKGKALYESTILLEFLEDAYPEYKPSLRPEDPYELAVARIWIDHINKNLLPAQHRLIQSQEPEKQDKAREELYDAQKKLVEHVKGPFFAGEKFGIVDAAIAPWIVRDWVITENREYKRENANEAWVKYAQAISERPSVKNTGSNKEHYFEIYAKSLRDEAQGAAARAIREGRPIP